MKNENSRSSVKEDFLVIRLLRPASVAKESIFLSLGLKFSQCTPKHIMNLYIISRHFSWERQAQEYIVFKANLRIATVIAAHVDYVLAFKYVKNGGVIKLLIFNPSLFSFEIVNLGYSLFIYKSTLRLYDQLRSLLISPSDCSVYFLVKTQDEYLNDSKGIFIRERTLLKHCCMFITLYRHQISEIAHSFIMS